MDANASIFATHATGTMMVIGGIQWLKKAKWMPWIKAGEKYIARAVSIVAAFCVQVGINYNWTTNANGTHTLLISDISFAAIAIGFFHVFGQFFYQETGYQFLQGIQATQGILNFLQTAAPYIPVAPTPEPVTESSAPAPQNAPIMPRS